MANAAAAAAEDVTKALATAQAASEAQGTEGKQTPTPGEGEPGESSESFVQEDAALAALIAEQAKLDAEAAGKVEGKAKEGEAVELKGEVKEGDAEAAAKAKAKVDADAAAAAAATATNPQTQAIIALRKELGNTRATLLIKEGENRALKALVDPAKAAAVTDGDAVGEPAPSTEEALTAIEAEREALAAKVDAGQMTMVEYTKQVNALGRQERELVLAEAEALANAAAAANRAPTTDLALEESTNALIAEYPVLSKLTRAQLDPINALAYQQLELEGKPITSESPSETKRLRHRMADLAEQLYDAPAHDARKTKSVTAAAAVPAKPGAGNVRVLPTAEQRAAKLDLAAAMPPEVGKVGAGAPAGELTEEQIAAALSGNEDQRIAFMESHPQLIAKVMGPGFRVRR